MKKFCQKQGGFTLLEVLLSIVLLSIVLTSFLGFFTQSALFTNRNEEKLSALQTAQKVVALIDMNTTVARLKAENVVGADGKVVSPGIVYDEKANFSRLFNFEVNTSFKVTLQFTDGPENSRLVQCKVTVTDGKVPPAAKSETFTYIR
ncbi:type IV pilus modification PilV family protein [Bacillus sp. FJAT-27245]|uniref:type IV pilus modification PilV family protein n=1 Tax=Bacillus sp. FJAT-27245 TaxID=1684144 RepID=UPI0006A7ACAF|nr:type II secretion system protein [Bacillus sp. FJAT-27245]